MTALPELKRYTAVPNGASPTMEPCPHIGDQFYRCEDVDALLAELGRDAERYRWLREPSNDDCDVTVRTDIDGVTHGWHSLLGDELDEAIDAAMKANT